MKAKSILAAVLTILVMGWSGCTAKNKTTECVNPLTYTDIPDNDWIRVGDDYYMVSTTMYFCPGAPIMHSRDLVHWEIVSYVYDFLEDDDVYNLRNGRNAYGKGQWATSLRYNEQRIENAVIGEGRKGGDKKNQRGEDSFHSIGIE